MFIPLLSTDSPQRFTFWRLFVFPLPKPKTNKRSNVKSCAQTHLSDLRFDVCLFFFSNPKLTFWRLFVWFAFLLWRLFDWRLFVSFGSCFTQPSKFSNGSSGYPTASRDTLVTILALDVSLAVLCLIDGVESAVEVAQLGDWASLNWLARVRIPGRTKK